MPTPRPRSRRPPGDLGAFLAGGLVPRGGAPKKRPPTGDPEPLPELPVRRTPASIFAGLVSFGLHAAALGTAAVLLAAAGRSATEEPKPRTAPAPLRTVQEMELPEMIEVTTLVADHHVTADEPMPTRAGGVEARARPDDGDPGRGGRDEGAAALNLAEREQGIALTAATRSRLDRSQLERDRDGDDRSSPDPRRAMHEPMELTFLVVGTGKLALQRDAGEGTPSRGASWAGAPETKGAQAGAKELAAGEGERQRDAGSAVAGGAHDAPAQGWIHGAPGRDLRATADVKEARPEVADGRAANPTTEKGPAKDDKRAEQEVALPNQSLLHASPRGGNEKEGPGGEKGPGAPAAGGEKGSGSQAKALGAGGPGPNEADELDKRRLDYERRIKAKIHPLWANAFPRWAALDGLQGRAIIHFVVAADGTVTSATVARPSGIPEFDENVRRAVLRASPLPPVPEKLKAPFVMFLGFDSPNPTVK